MRKYTVTDSGWFHLLFEPVFWVILAQRPKRHSPGGRLSWNPFPFLSRILNPCRRTHCLSRGLLSIFPVTRHVRRKPQLPLCALNIHTLHVLRIPIFFSLHHYFQLNVMRTFYTSHRENPFNFHSICPSHSPTPLFSPLIVQLNRLSDDITDLIKIIEWLRDLEIKR